tara:strand:- start:1881 stop:3788 length:1908 start_codon:yes stop_codon:yes gene_type:complete
MTNHYIWRIKASKIDSKEVWFLDIETWGLNAQKFAFCVLKNLEGNKEHIFYDPKKLRKFLENQPNEIIVYAHNMWGFDGLAFFDKFEIKNAERIDAGSRIISIKFPMSDPKLKMDWRDSAALIPMRVSDIGESLKMPKGITPIDYIKGNERKITEEDIEYCRRDVDILRVAIMELEIMFNDWLNNKQLISRLPLTTGSMAYRVWATRFWPKHWETYHTRRSRAKGKEGQVLLDDEGNPKKTKIYRGFCDNKVNEAFQQAYFGGRVQVLGKPGKKYYNVREVDMNSMFPSVMFNNPYPDISRCKIQFGDKDQLLNLLYSDKHLVLAKVKLKASKNAQLFLPNTINKRRRWDCKFFKGYICEPELKYAIENGWEIIEVNSIMTCGKLYPFKGFIDIFWNLRRKYQKENDGKQIFVKLILNSLYGKFSQRSRPKRVDNDEELGYIMDNIPDFLDYYELKFYAQDIPYLEEIEPSIKSKNTWFGFASFITSYARVELQKAINAAGEFALYSDTDSVHYQEEAHKKLISELSIGNDLGQWKIETPDPIPMCRFWEPKAYTRYDNEGNVLSVKHKGVSIYNDEGNLKPEAGDLELTQKHKGIVKFYTSLRRGMVAGEGIETEKKSRKWWKYERNEIEEKET